MTGWLSGIGTAIASALRRMAAGAAQPEAAAFTWIDVRSLEARLDPKGAVRLIDVRGADEFAGPLGHIAGAVNIPLGELANRVSEVAPGPVHLICRTDRRSASAAAMLKNAGFAELHVVRGGMQEWNRLGLPVGRG